MSLDPFVVVVCEDSRHVSVLEMSGSVSLKLISCHVFAMGPVRLKVVGVGAGEEVAEVAAVVTSTGMAPGKCRGEEDPAEAGTKTLEYTWETWRGMSRGRFVN